MTEQLEQLPLIEDGRLEASKMLLKIRSLQERNRRCINNGTLDAEKRKTEKAYFNNIGVINVVTNTTIKVDKKSSAEISPLCNPKFVVIKATSPLEIIPTPI